MVAIYVNARSEFVLVFEECDCVRYCGQRAGIHLMLQLIIMSIFLVYIKVLNVHRLLIASMMLINVTLVRNVMFVDY